MTPEMLGKKLYIGRGKAAMRLGVDYMVMRPAMGSNPLTNKIATIKVSLNARDPEYRRPSVPGNPYWYADMDGNQTVPGDYLVLEPDAGRIFFVAAQQLMLPIICVECNRFAWLPRTVPAVEAVGIAGYSGVCDSLPASRDMLGINPIKNGGLLVGWPCSIVFGRDRLRNPDALPGGTPVQAGWQILLPASIPVDVVAGDRIADDLGRTYLVNGAEKTDLGWRIQAVEVHA